MAAILCKCGEHLSNSSVPNDIRYYVYSDREWMRIIEMNVVDTTTLPIPKNDVWKCGNCDRIHVFNEQGDLVQTYVLEKEPLVPTGI